MKMQWKSKAAGVFVASLVVVLALAATARAGTVEWNYDGTSTTSVFWTVAASWNPAQWPTPDNDVLLGTVITNNRQLRLSTGGAGVPANWDIKSLTVDDDVYVYSINQGGYSNRTITLQSGNLTVGAEGAFLTNSPGNGDGRYVVSLVIPNSLAATWDIQGPTLVGSILGAGSTGTTVTKTGAGTLTLTGGVNPNGAQTITETYAGAYTINQGAFVNSVRMPVLSGVTVTPAVSGYDATLMSVGFGLGSGSNATFQGNAGDNAVIMAGASAGEISRLKIGTSGNGNTAYFKDLSKFHADLSGTQDGYSDGLGVTGTLDLGAPGTTNSLYISLGSGSLQSGYVLAAGSTGMTGKFNSVYYNGSLIGSPESAGAINTTHRLVYGGNYILLENPSTNTTKFWINPDAGSLLDTDNWTSAPAYDGTDRLVVPTTGGVITTPDNWTAGEVTAYGGGFHLTGGTPAVPYVWRMSSDCGLSGDFRISGPETSITGAAGATKIGLLDVDGNVDVNPDRWSIAGLLVRMRGLATGNPTYSFSSAVDGVCWGVDVDNTVTNITFAAPPSGYNGMRMLTLNNTGAASGDVYINHVNDTQT
ncbi:MAG TPA: hypothetical protein VMX57_07430, partial [Planctomycetota bacterium]|nr:hypothetical protein [Planctomycetota bacterium]